MLANVQLQDVYDAIGISSELSSEERLQALRNIPASDLVEVLPRLKMSNFRAVTDDDLIHADMQTRFEDGTLAKVFLDRGYRLMTGETETEVLNDSMRSRVFGAKITSSNFFTQGGFRLRPKKSFQSNYKTITPPVS